MGDGLVRASGCRGCGVDRDAPCGAPDVGDGDRRRRSPCAGLGGAREHLDRHGQWACRPLDSLRSRMDVDRRRLRTLALARALSRRSRRRRGRGARTRCSRRGSDRGRRGRGVRGAHARLDRTVAPQLDCAAAARHRARSLVAARRHGRNRSRTAAGAEGSEGPCAGRTRPAVPGIKPAWTDPLATDFGFEWDRETQGDAVEARVASSDLEASREAGNRFASPPRSGKHTSRSIWFYVVAAIVLVVLVLAALLAARLLSTRFAWRRVRRRLAVGAPADQVTGAWAWTRMRLEACRLPLAVDVSPDVVVAGRAMDDVPADVYTPLQALAARTTTAAFSREQSLRAARGRRCVDGGRQGGQSRHAST